MVDKSEWRVADPGFQMLPPKLERSAGRPRVKRIKSRGEPGKRGPYQCKRCFQFGHIEKGCRKPPIELGAELPPSLPAKSGKRKGETSKSKKGSKNTSKKSKKAGAATTSTSLVTQAPVSPGPTTRRMTASTSTPTRPLDSPLSPGPTTRRMAAQLDISPGGIA
ncbi:hypothetical protein GQ55_9G340400 [Panicum hallii var. hallii]|uniref:CCHC-type domain-containing protein n=1 Tax=Panicum hallii var. hallii TaxID=1504633 RepID=A0A2T7C8D9_9POAL|nr:hypothetical protein GQ55_9G340400 [Panicum hallii var. hallii]